MAYYQVSDLSLLVAPSAICGGRIIGHGPPELWPVLWDVQPRRLDDIMYPADGQTAAWAMPRGINSAGDIVGWWAPWSYSQYYVTPGSWQAFIRKANGAFSRFGAMFGSGDSVLNDINDSGVAVGRVGTNAISFDTATALIKDHGKPPGCRYAEATHVNDGGDILVRGDTAKYFLLRSDEYIDLGTSSVCRITDSRLIAGNVNGLGPALYDTSDPHPRWQQNIGDDYVCADINEDRVAVGRNEHGAVVWSMADGLQSLNTLSRGSGWRLDAAALINAAGQIVGRGVNPLGQPSAFLATPSPAPDFELPEQYYWWPLLKPWLWGNKPRFPRPNWLSLNTIAELALSSGATDPDSQEVMRGLMLNRLAEEISDDRARQDIRQASLDLITRTVERLRRDRGGHKPV